MLSWSQKEAWAKQSTAASAPQHAEAPTHDTPLLAALSSLPSELAHGPLEYDSGADEEGGEDQAEDEDFDLELLLDDSDVKRTHPPPLSSSRSGMGGRSEIRPYRLAAKDMKRGGVVWVLVCDAREGLASAQKVVKAKIETRWVLVCAGVVPPVHGVAASVRTRCGSTAAWSGLTYVRGE